ncbi:hypothetical protein D3C71_1448710 [compost metagenome]
MNEQEASMLERLIASQQSLTDSLIAQAASSQALSEAILALAQAVQEQNLGAEEEGPAGSYLDGRPI